MLLEIILTFLQNIQTWAKIVIFAKKSILTSHFRGVEYSTGPENFFLDQKYVEVVPKKFHENRLSSSKISIGVTPLPQKC